VYTALAVGTGCRRSAASQPHPPLPSHCRQMWMGDHLRGSWCPDAGPAATAALPAAAGAATAAAGAELLLLPPGPDASSSLSRTDSPEAASEAPSAEREAQSSGRSGTASGYRLAMSPAGGQQAAGRGQVSTCMHGRC